ncbi:restriction endonuclease subunit S [Desulfobacter postgatei]|jgi:type I restriction enzyme S subunit|uniref:restriction endonuclease subunit S n=1 Tax=Desulfobacter postgatei TaxID=2293 RepID=UPI002A361400|nr:restriction endonuclease subunit S [Desulfobacter postgatei]MDX9963266.1 restriction endonuclease subunit S [Desulfobacter postgatei]
MKIKDKKKQSNSQGLVPKLRFPEFQDAPKWKKKKLGKAVSLNLRKKEKPSKNYIGLGVRSYGKGTFLKKAENPEKNSMDYLYEVSEDDLVVSITFAWEGALAIAQRSDCGALVSHRFPTYTFQSNTAISSFFRYIILDNFFIYNLGVISPGGAGRNRVLNKKDFLKLSVFLPEITEQQKIADCLSSLDELIAGQAHKLDTLKAHKKGLMQQLFPAPGQTTPTLRFPEFQEAGDWEGRPLESICGMQAGKFVSASKINEKFEAGLYPCYGGNGLRGFTRTHTHTGKYPLIGRQGALCGNIFFAKEKFHATEHAIVATPFKGIDITWLYYLLVHLNLNQYATGQAQPGLSVDILKKVTTIIPAKEKEQKKIANCFSSLDELIAAQIQKLDTLKVHKKGLMQQLFPNPDKAAE